MDSRRPLWHAVPPAHLWLTTNQPRVYLRPRLALALFPTLALALARKLLALALALARKLPFGALSSPLVFPHCCFARARWSLLSTTSV